MTNLIGLGNNSSGNCLMFIIYYNVDNIIFSAILDKFEYV